MRLVFSILAFCCFVGSSTPALANKTSAATAEACIAQIVTDSKKGGSFASLVEKYLHAEMVAARSAKVQGRGAWDSFAPAEKKRFLDDVRRYFNKEKERVAKQKSNKDDVDLDSIILNSARGKSVGNAFQLTGTYQTIGGEKINFGAMILKQAGRCWVIDARWKDAWLSAFLPLSN